MRRMTWILVISLIGIGTSMISGQRLPKPAPPSGASVPSRIVLTVPKSAGGMEVLMVNNTITLLPRGVQRSLAEHMSMRFRNGTRLDAYHVHVTMQPRNPQGEGRIVIEPAP